MKASKLNSGISTIKLTELIQANMPFVNRDMIKNNRICTIEVFLMNK